MTYRTSSQPIFATLQVGLNSVFNQLQSNNTLTLQSLQNATNLGSNHLPFSQYLQQNFSSIDKNNDNKITQNEFNVMVNGLSNDGLTMQQLYSLASQSGYSSDSQKELIEKVLSNFNKIDENGDGKVSQAEIDKFMLNKEKEEKMAELNKVKTSDYTMFYGDTTETTESSSSSSISDDF